MLPLAARAQDADAERPAALEACLVEVSGLEEAALFRNLLAGMIVQDADVARQFLTPIVLRTRDIGIERCGQPENFTEMPWASNVLGNYIQTMLIGIFSESMLWLQGL